MTQAHPHGTLLRTASITGIGAYAPARVLTNDELSRMVDTSDEWISSRTGIKERHIAADGEFTSDMAAAAARRALESAGADPASLDLIIAATATPDTPFPSTGCWIQQKIGATHAAAFDITAACSGFLYGLNIGRQFIATGAANRVLVVGAEKISAITDWTDRNTCVLFGDGAGAALLEHRPGSAGILDILLGSDGREWEILNIPAGGCRMPASETTVRDRLHTIRMSGRDVFKVAVLAMQNAAVNALERAGVAIDDIAWVIPHQANTRIMHAIAGRLGVGLDRFIINIERFGNTSAASIPLALDEAVRDGRVKRGDKILMVAFGGGLTWASAVVEW